MSVEAVEARSGAYADSVTLLQVSRRVADGEGVEAALVAMGTELNLDLVRGMGFTVPADTGPNDLVIAVRAISDDALVAAQAAVEQALAPAPRSEGGPAAQEPPRTTAAALRRAPADLVLVSVPGQYAFAEASDALAAGSDVLIFSDNVPVEQELALKRRAVSAGRLVMGPDCGTAVVGGVGLGFANVVQRGPVGLVAASGTGAQQLLCLFDHAGVGVSACLGVGGRDLSAAVGGLSTLAALDALDADPATSLIVVVSKPPAAEVAERVREHAATLGTPVRFALLTPGEQSKTTSNGSGRGDLTAAAEAALGDLGRPVPEWPAWVNDRTARPGALRGLYSGGTLCDEAMLLATAALGPIRSNIPLSPDLALDATMRADGHLMIDFGDDELTRGRPHPMIDASLRLQRLAAEAADPSTSVVLLDVVLGHGAHPDPAAELAPAIAAAGELAVVVALIGSTGDPQGFAAQAARLHEAGADVFASNAAAARRAIGLVQA
jgi:FdrA protein